MIAALFVAKGGCYFGLDDVDPWDEDRDARKYAGPHPVVAHPPCERWCQLAHVNQARYGHKVGDDDGCFASALVSVGTWGGVLEHPAHSYAWEAYGLLKPVRGKWMRQLGDHGWVTEVHQIAYGHRARKATWLYVVGIDPPPLCWDTYKPTATVSFMTNHGGGTLPRLGKKEAKATPVEFRDTLLRMARSVHRKDLA